MARASRGTGAARLRRTALRGLCRNDDLEHLDATLPLEGLLGHGVGVGRPEVLRADPGLEGGLVPPGRLHHIGHIRAVGSEDLHAQEPRLVFYLSGTPAKAFLEGLL